MYSKMTVQFSCSVVSDCFRPQGLQHARLPCSSPTQRLLKLISIKLVMPSNHLILCHPLLLLLSIFPSIRVFSSESILCQSIGASASASVLPMNIQYWFPLGLTGLISVQSKGLSRVFYNTTVQKHQFFITSYIYMYIYFISFPLISHYKILNIVPCARTRCSSFYIQ